MSHLIQLSLIGDGWLVVLTPQTVRKAFFQFTKVNNEYTGREKYSLDCPIHYKIKEKKVGNKKSLKHQIKQPIPTVNDALHRYNCKFENRLYSSNFGNKDSQFFDESGSLSYLHIQDILKVERQINRYILNSDLALVENEGELLTGYGVCEQAQKNRQKVQYIIRYGMFFILESINLQTVIKMRNVDIFIQDSKTFDFHLVRFRGILLSSLKSKINLSFCHRLNYSQRWTQTLEQFKPRQIFRITKIYPCPGFRILNVS